MNKLEFKKNEIIDLINKSKIVTEWHWFGYNFGFGKIDGYTRFGKAFVDALSIIDTKIEGYSRRTIKKIESYSGRDRDENHYQQLLQICGEIYILKQAVLHFSKFPDTLFRDEPKSLYSKKNPEFSFEFENITYGIEVKLPSLNEHMMKRTANPIQITGRCEGVLGSYEKNVGINNITLPVDNKIKSFLTSANEKFEGFKVGSENFVSILFILWDDFMYEPISALITKPHGLFLEDTFAVENGSPMRYENVDYVFIDRPLSNFREDTACRCLLDNKQNCFDYGKHDEFPFKVYFRNPYSKGETISSQIKECFQLKEYSTSLGAEYCPTDFVFWL